MMVLETSSSSDSSDVFNCQRFPISLHSLKDIQNNFLIFRRKVEVKHAVKNTEGNVGL